MATVVDGDPKAPFSLATSLRCTERRNSFPWIPPFTLVPYLIMLSVKQFRIKNHFWVLGKIRPGFLAHWRTLYPLDLIKYHIILCLHIYISILSNYRTCVMISAWNWLINCPYLIGSQVLSNPTRAIISVLTLHLQKIFRNSVVRQKCFFQMLCYKANVEKTHSKSIWQSSCC